MPAPPDDLTEKAILDAKGDELRFWIDRANSEARAHGGYKRNPLAKAGKVGELRKRLADFYGLELCAAAPKPDTAAAVKKAPLDVEIQRMQWAHIRDLGKEWEKSVSSGVPFQLCIRESGELPNVCSGRCDRVLKMGAFLAEHCDSVHPHLQRDIRDVLVRCGAGIQLSPAPDQGTSLEPPSTDTICAWLAAAQHGNIAALANLFHLQSHMQVWSLAFIIVFPKVTCVLRLTGQQAQSTLCQTRFLQSTSSFLPLSTLPLNHNPLKWVVHPQPNMLSWGRPLMSKQPCFRPAM
jgi:hypothetical protein